MASYTALFGKAEDGTWSGYIPDLSCVVAMGDTLELATENMKEALGFWVENMREKGFAIPVPSSHSATIEVAI